MTIIQTKWPTLSNAARKILHQNKSNLLFARFLYNLRTSQTYHTSAHSIRTYYVHTYEPLYIYYYEFKYVVCYIYKYMKLDMYVVAVYTLHIDTALFDAVADTVHVVTYKSRPIMYVWSKRRTMMLTIITESRWCGHKQSLLATPFGHVD